MRPAMFRHQGYAGSYHTGAPLPLATPYPTLSQRGLTLIELIVTIAVLSMVVTWVIPSYQGMNARYEVVSEVMRLKMALAQTRSAAITRRTTVTLCPSVDLIHCQISNNAEGNAWRATLAVFEGRGEAGDTLLRTFGESPLPALTYRNDNRPVRYNYLGRSGGHNGTFRLCGRLDNGAKVIVNNVGRVRVESQRPNC